MMASLSITVERLVRSRRTWLLPALTLIAVSVGPKAPVTNCCIVTYFPGAPVLKYGAEVPLKILAND
jgi:hypothetical protein